MSQENLYTCLIQEQSQDEAFLQSYWARGSHIGEAIAKMLAAARKNGLSNPSPREIDSYAIEDLQIEVHPSPESDVFFSTTRYFYPPEPWFDFPTGIIPSHNTDESDDVHEIRSGYCRTLDDDGLIEIGVNVESPDLLQLYGKILRCFDTYETFWYLIHDHWGNAENEFFENSALNTPDAIIHHLNDSLSDSVHNGFVTLTAYARQGETNINISEHKRIIVLTYSEEVADVIEATLKAQGLSGKPSLVSFDSRIHHWHYRPSESLMRKNLITHLVSQGFSCWNPNDESTQTLDASN